MAQENIILFTQGGASIQGLEGAIVTSENHSFGNEVVSQTIENGSALADHIIIQPDQLELTLFVSNVDGNNQPLQGETAKTVLSTLKALQMSRQPVTVMTQHLLYTNMAIETVNASHLAPFKGLLNPIAVKFKKLDFTNTLVGNITQYLNNIITAIGNFMTQPSVNYAGLITQAIAAGKFPASDVASSAMSLVSIGNLIAAGSTTSNATFLASLQNQYAQGQTAAAPSASLYDSLWLDIESDVQYLQPVAAGAQSFVAQLANATLSFSLTFSTLGGCWLVNVADATQNPLITGGLLAPGCNPIRGLNLLDASDNPILGGIHLSSTMAGAENTPYSFVPNASGNSPCCIMLTSQTGEADLEQATELLYSPRSLNFLLSDMDYTSA